MRSPGPRGDPAGRPEHSTPLSLQEKGGPVAKDKLCSIDALEGITGMPDDAIGRDKKGLEALTLSNCRVRTMWHPVVIGSCTLGHCKAKHKQIDE